MNFDDVFHVVFKDFVMIGPEAVSYREKEKLCESLFVGNGPYWHMYTDGNCQSIIFSNADDFRVGMNLIAVCAAEYPEVKVYTFELMNNHLHLIFAGDSEAGRKLFRSYKKRLHRYFVRQGKVVDLSGFECSLCQVEDLRSLRNEIVYVNRNGYLVHPDCTPYSYPWGANAAFFNPFLTLLPSVSYDSLKVKEKRLICHSNEVCLGDGDLLVYDGIVLPSSYCDITEAEGFFRDAHHYFYLLTRNYEAYGKIAERMHDAIFLTDEEMYAAISAICLKRYNVKQPSLLSGQQKVEVARCMHGEYNASNRQIRSILKMAVELVDELFPRSR